MYETVVSHLLPTVAEGVYLPGDVGEPALPEGVIEVAEAERHLLDDPDIAGHGLVIHTPAQYMCTLCIVQYRCTLCIVH